MQDPSPLATKIGEMGFVKEGEYQIPKPIDDIVDSIALSRIDPSTNSII